MIDLAGTANVHRRICLALTGASGMPYGLRLLDCLLQAGIHVELVYSAAAQIVAREECDLGLSGDTEHAYKLLIARNPTVPGSLRVYGRDAWFAPIASGSNPADAMVICPCSMGTLAAIAHGMAEHLIDRAADVMLKEKRPLILVPRETPLSRIHLDNMLRLHDAGALILPPNPGFYHRPQTLDDLVDFVVARILDALSIPHNLLPRWGNASP